MFKLLTKNWWVVVLRGVLLIIFALFAFFNPLLTAASLAMWFAFLIIADGFFTLFSLFSDWEGNYYKWLFLVEGAISIIFGLLLFRMPGVTLLLVSFIISFWFIFVGISRIAMAIQLRKKIEGEGWLIAGGILSVVFGLIIFAQPALGIGFSMFILGFAALLVGIALLVIGFKLRKGQDWVKDKKAEIKDRLKDS